MPTTLAGYKTYIMAGAGIVLTVLYILKVIDVEQWSAGMGLLGFGSIATLRAGVTKSGPESPPKPPTGGTH